MPWESLGKSLDSKPRVLAGPILRKVTPTSVTVWLAMRIGATVALTVQDETNIQVMQGERRSVAIGKHLHIVAVTASMFPPFVNITEGIVYRYDLTFSFDDNFSGNLATATNNALLAYAPWTLPSFALPPKDLNLLRLVQGSCRMPHAEGTDMLPFISQLIEQSAGNAFARPHQLLLTGDQIYADDVAESMLIMLTDASDTLLDWKEVLPFLDSRGGPGTAASQSPTLRGGVLNDAGFTSVDLGNHLMSLGEYLCMYLFVWSDTLWSTTGIPSFTDILSSVKKNLSPESFSIFGRILEREKTSTETRIGRLVDFQAELPKVRRLLANVPSYMIFDDHEVTDDWNMTREFCNNVYGNELGLRVVQNALVAYSLCQHWGNVPEDFEPTGTFGSGTAGASLLKLLDTSQPTVANAFQQKAADYDRISKDIRKLLAIHGAVALRGRDDNALFHDPQSLRYDFTIEGPGHQVIFTDTRTWRSFPRNANGTNLLTKNQQTDQFKQQILDAPNTRDRLLFVVLTTNAPPVQPIRAATRHDTIANIKRDFPDLYEAWDLPSVSFDRLLVALTSKLPLDASNQHTGAVILLSGDVHHSFATRIIYRATKRYEDDTQPKAATAVIAQLVASSFKKQTDDTVRFHREGYYAAPYGWVSQTMIRHTLTEGYVGWNFPKGANEVVGTFALGSGMVSGIILPISIDKGTVDVSKAEPLTSQTPSDSRMIDLTQKPHYRYRLDYLLPTMQVVETIAPSIPPLSKNSSLDERKNAARAFHRAIRSYQRYNRKKPPNVVGVNNFGEIKLHGDATSRKVNHIVRWWDADDSVLKITTYSVRLDINSPTDQEFPDIKARVEP
jgi:PhoD-like phosphatase